MRLVLATLVLSSTLFLSSCDSGSSVSTTDVDGEYFFTQLVFEADAAIVGTVDVLSYLRQIDGQPDMRLDLFGRSQQYVLAFRFPNDQARNSISGGFGSRGASQIELRLGDDSRQRLRLLLPGTLPLAFNNETGRLTAELRNYAVAFQDLATLDPQRFGGLNGETRGTLRIQANRR